jgi:hypothetical protein
MNRVADAYVDKLPVQTLDCLDISGNPDRWAERPWRSYRSTQYPGFDICAGPLALEAWDVILAEQVLEHVLEPSRAALHAWQMLRKDGIFIVSTPFLIKYHPSPIDVSRWTEVGLKQLLQTAGFNDVTTGSWGNRQCVIADLRRERKWTYYQPWRHSLENDPLFPVVVWAFARKH